ncbi:MAG TPA: AraC family transcriptional regulator [Bacilli bacterium]
MNRNVILILNLYNIDFFSNGEIRLLAINTQYNNPWITWMGFVSYKTPWTHFKRNIDEYVLYLIAGGELHIEENGVRYILKKSDVLVLEPNLDHEGFDKRTCDYYYVHFKHPDIYSTIMDDIEKLSRLSILEDQNMVGDNTCFIPKNFTITKTSTLSQAITIVEEMRQLHKRMRFNHNLSALRFTELLIRLSRESMASTMEKNGMSSKGYHKVHGLLEYIHQNYQTKITRSVIESNFECNFDYMNRLFNNFTGYSIIHYVNKVRIDHAQELMMATNLNYGEIAYQVGFNDPYYFSKVFKKYLGCSPTEYYLRL